jgi:hypothetical protein
MKKWLYIIIATALCTGCRSIPETWWNNPPENTPSTLYFVGVSPPGKPPDVARNAAEADGRAKFVASWETEVKTQSRSTVDNQRTNYQADMEQRAEGLVKKMMPIKYHTDKNDYVVYVLMSISRPLVDNELNRPSTAWTEYVWKQLTHWWWQENDINGNRIYASIGGWNFWRLNDDGYIYSDPVTAAVLGTTKNTEGENQFNQFFPMIWTLGYRRPISGIVIFGAEVSNAKISTGLGLSVPLFTYNFNITPWFIGGLGWTNGEVIPAPVFDGGLDFAFNLRENRVLIIGIDVTYMQDTWTSPPNWRALGYGLSAGIKW